MSASLVGSEMCIRDRAHSEPVFVPSAHMVARTSPELKGGPFRTGLGAAVSYTHLTLPTICSV
eukprot:8274442-Alexandrium_andersonii.AAC.1